MARNFEFGVGEYYHAYNRGNDKRRIFRSAGDKKRFMQLLYLCNGDRSFVYRDLSKHDIFTKDKGGNLVNIGAYCLMWNHFHLLLHECIEGGISKFMQKLTTAYVMYFNTKYKKTGTPLEGSYKAKHIDYDEYLKYIFSYIHLNPVEHIFPEWDEKRGISNPSKAFGYLGEYKESSLLDYTGENRPEKTILNKAAFPGYFEGAGEMKGELLFWLTTEV